MNHLLHSLAQRLRRGLVPVSLILLLVLTFARLARPTVANEPVAEESSSAGLAELELTGRLGYFQSSELLTSTPTPTPIPPTPTPTDTPTPIPPTPTPIPPTPTDTPTPIPPTPTPTDTPTPLPPTPTPIPPTPTDTPTPIPPTPTPTDTPTPIPPTPTNTPTSTPTPIPPTPTPTATPLPLPPELGPIVSDPADGVVAVGVAIEFTAVFTDPDSFSGHTAVWNWDDDSSTTQNNINSPVQASHAYGAPGIYTVGLIVTDSDDLSASATYQYVVVYDPNGGFVTGGGWIDSPAEAYIPAPSLTGKATFAFVSKYTKGKQVPTGNTQFKFKTASLNFSSDNYYWLVVTGGDTAKFSGSGTINDQLAPNGDPYKFKVWANDGQPDTFRIRIWWEYIDGSEIDIYDNAADQPIDGGSIVVQKGKGK